MSGGGICLFCNQLVTGTDRSGTVTCTACDKPAIARTRLEADRYERGSDGEYTASAKWLRGVDMSAINWHTPPPLEEETSPDYFSATLKPDAGRKR